MSEFGDIFFDLKLHVQDACKNEIEKTDLFILIIGNSYGSIYHTHKEQPAPDSVTLQEFKKCLDVGIPKYIFINKFLKHDFDNYRRTKAISYAAAFERLNKEIPESEFTNEYNKTYPFPQESYRHIFKFLELTESLNKNNALYTFESFDEIKEALKKQWAALFYTALRSERSSKILSNEEINEKLSKIESHIEMIAKEFEKKPGRDKKNPSPLSEEIHKEQAHKLQEKVSFLLDSFFLENGESRIARITKKTSTEEAIKAFDQIKELLKKFKLSKTIPIEEIFHPEIIGRMEYFPSISGIPYASLQSLISIKESLEADEQNALYTEFTRRLNYYQKDLDDELPF